MLSTMQTELLKRFYQSLRDRSLEPDDPYYVPYLENHPRHDPIARLVTRIAWSEAASVSLLSGQRGSGKSTGLRRLKRVLEQQGCVVFLCDMRDYLNLTTPVEVSDFFIASMGALDEAVIECYGEDFTAEDFWTRIKRFLNTEVQLEGADFDAGVGTIKTSLKDDPSFKRRLQERMRGHLARLVQQAHGFGAEVVRAIRKHERDPDKKVVLILDSVEQIRGVGAEANKVYESVENLFAAHAQSLQFDLLHIVYTIPPYLTPLAPNLGLSLGGGLVYSMPGIHLYHRGGALDESGFAVLQDIIGKRCPEWVRVFSEDQLRRVASSTGGDLREFFRLLREILMLATIANDDLPVDYELIKDARQQLRREMLPIAEDDKIWLKRIAESKEAELDDVVNLPQLARFFDTNLVQNYCNSEDWYDVHPLIRDALA